MQTTPLASSSLGRLKCRDETQVACQVVLAHPQYSRPQAIGGEHPYPHPLRDGSRLERGETEVALAFSNWIRTHPAPLVIDIGASIGQFSTLALFADPAATVVALDSSLGSLTKLTIITRYASGQRLDAVWGFIVDRSDTDKSIAIATAATRAKLAEGENLVARMISLGDKDFDDIGNIPRYTVDGLFADIYSNSRPILLKCDIEAAEVLMLRGAKDFIARCKPTIFLSVHRDDMLAGFGHTKDDVRVLLKEYGYKHALISQDHEEHWLCEPV